MVEKKRILVIGAGVSGLTAIKACKEEHLDVVCYEKTGEHGGLWRYQESRIDGQSTVMKNTVSNASKEMSAFSDFPPPGKYPAFMHHQLVIAYLDSYAEHFDLLKCITYFQEVTELIPSEEYVATGGWIVKVRDLSSGESRTETFDGIMICTGHHCHPFTPSYPNQEVFSGQTMHSHGYKTFEGMEGRKVLVVGAGNSGADIAAEVSAVADKVYLSTRRGAWIYPRLCKKGKPIDVYLNRRYKTLLPSSYVSNQIQKTLNKRMNHARFGIRPHHPVSCQHPTVNDEIQCKILLGLVTIKKDVKEFTKNGVVFVDEDQETPVDVVVFATGFNFQFPFLSDDILRIGKDNRVSLYKNMFPPQLKHPSLAIIGLINPPGSLFPIFEMQSRWFASLVNGHRHLPTTEEMIEDVRQVHGFRARTYVQSPRHAIETHWLTYMDDIGSLLGVKPNMPALFFTDPKLFGACLFGPCLPYQYRLIGPHSWEGARSAILNYKSRMYEYLNKDNCKA